MKAMVFFEHGGPEVLRMAEVPTPDAGPGQVLVRVKAIGMNHLDLWARQGLPGIKLPLPFILGSDISGVVEMVGTGVTGLNPGQRVVINPALWDGTCEYCIRGEHSLCVDFKILGEHVPGGYAEFVAVPKRNVMPMPDEFTFEEAAALPLASQTAWRALITQAGLRAGEDCLILGAGGGVASVAIQIARLAGARVFAVSSTPEKLEQARRLGADILINYKEQDFSRVVWEITKKRGVDVVLENVGQPTWKQSLRSLARGGRLVTYGGTAGPIGETDIRILFWKQVKIIGSTMSNRHEFDQVMKLVWQRQIVPVIDRVVPISQARAAHEVLAGGHQFGKIILTADFD
ncbi:MAG: zinc-binding dehydrogenase [Chloroflexi bacterium]|nr:zinc-binding dehydrogenase [Chloroflexota bacterium]